MKKIFATLSVLASLSFVSCTKDAFDLDDATMDVQACHEPEIRAQHDSIPPSRFDGPVDSLVRPFGKRPELLNIGERPERDTVINRCGSVTADTTAHPCNPDGQAALL